MSQKANLPFSIFRAYLTGDKRAYLTGDKRLSTASAETYVKHVRRALIATNADETLNLTAEELLGYDATLSVAMRDGFRAAWGHYVEYLRVKHNFAVAHAPSKSTRRPSSRDDSSGT